MGRYPEKTLYAMVREAAGQHPDRLAYQFMGKRTDYRQMLRRIDAAAAGLAQLGIGPGDCVTICMPNTPQAVDCFYALNRLGAVANVIHPLCAPAELEFHLTLTQSKAILVLDQFYEKVAALQPSCKILVAGLRRELPRHKRLFYKDKALPRGNYLRWEQIYRWNLPAGKPADDPYTCACILYSGGSTGKPKGVSLSSMNFNCAAIQTLAACGYEDIAGMKMLAVLPIFHGFGLGVGIHTPLIAGAGCILVPRFQLNSYIRLILRYKPDFLPGVPALFDALLKSRKLRYRKLDFLKGIFCGGDSLPPTLKAEMDAFLQAHGCTERLREGYGMTECVSVSCLTPRFAEKENTIGLPLADMCYKIVKPGTTQALENGQAGEICISGPSVMLGYLNDPQETALALQTHGDGKIWLHTADLGSMDQDGYVRFLQRLKRLIVTNGYNVYPTHLEQVLCQHPQVAACCVIGVPDARRGQRVKAYIVPKTAPGPALEQDLWAYCAEHIARYAMPRELAFRDSLPMTHLNKVDFKKLEEESSNL